jgi:ubiquinone biosynthesis protein UbiJ
MNNDIEIVRKVKYLIKSHPAFAGMSGMCSKIGGGAHSRRGLPAAAARRNGDTMADQILFDKLGFIDRLKRGGVDENHARAHAEAMEAALRESVATKSDIARLETKIERLETKIELAVRNMTIRTGTIAIALFAALASIKFFG